MTDTTDQVQEEQAAQDPAPVEETPVEQASSEQAPDERDEAREPAETAPSAADEPGPLGRIELPLEVRLGELELPLERVLQLREGDAVPIGPDEDQLVTLLVHGEPYAKGELVVVDERFAFRVGRLLADQAG